MRHRWTAPELNVPFAARWLLAALCLALCCTACAQLYRDPTPTPDYAALETRVASSLRATLTAKAPPTATRTATPTAEPSTPTPNLSQTPTLTPTSTDVPRDDLLAYVQQAEDGVMNVLLQNLGRNETTRLTHFLEQRHLYDLSWSKDGMWLIFVSAREFMYSRQNERNIYAMRADGTELRMITGDYMDPDTAPGPYVTLRGQIVGGQGACRVCAQGATSVVVSDEDGRFVLPGVPASAAWARAVCQLNGDAWQGVVDLQLSATSDREVTITMQPGGQGWSQASLSRDNSTLAGVYYLWAVNDEGERGYTTEGFLYDWSGTPAGVLEVPDDTTLTGVDWSPVADELVGTLVAEKTTWLWHWDAQGKSLGALLEMPNTERLILAAGNPAFSPDGDAIAFELRQWDWWEETERKTEVFVYRLGDGEATRLVETAWGEDALHPSWASNNQRIYYQLSTDGSGIEADSQTSGTLWSVTLDGQTTRADWAIKEMSFFPAAHPLYSDFPQMPRVTPTPAE